MIIIDIDYFKQVNDRYGHLVGDTTLKRVSGVLRDNSRRSDVVSRMGGDELAILMPGTSLGDAITHANRLLREVRALEIDLDKSELEGGSVHEACTVRVTVSMGLAHLPTHAVDVQELYRAADTALYAAKRGGRDQLGVEEIGAGRRGLGELGVAS